MSIKASDNGWRIDVTRGKQRFRKLVTTSKRDAEEIERDAIYRMENNLPLEAAHKASNFTMRELVELTNTMRWANHKSDSQYRTAWNVLDFLECRNSQVSTVLNSDLPTKLEIKLQDAGLSPATANKYKSTLRAMIEVALENGYIHSKPSLKLTGKSRKRNAYFTKEKEKLFLDTLRALGLDELCNLAMFAIDTGGRVSELLEITHEEVDNNAVMFGDTKNGTDRVIPLTNRAQEIIKGRTGKLFDFDYEQIKYRWRKARVKLGLDADYCFHVCRHTFVTRLLQAQHPTPMVQKLSGHKDINSLTHYAHADMSHLQDMINSLN